MCIPSQLCPILMANNYLQYILQINMLKFNINIYIFLLAWNSNNTQIFFVFFFNCIYWVYENLLFVDRFPFEFIAATKAQRVAAISVIGNITYNTLWPESFRKLSIKLTALKILQHLFFIKLVAQSSITLPKMRAICQPVCSSCWKQSTSVVFCDFYNGKNYWKKNLNQIFVF